MNLVLSNLTLHVGGTILVDDVNVRLTDCGVVGLVGPNGSGKSTLANILSGLVKPTAGQAVLGSHVLTRMSPEEISAVGVGRVFQTQQLAWNMTVFENVTAAFDQHRVLTLPAVYRGVRIPPTPQKDEASLPEAGETVVKVIDDVGLSDAANVPARDLSFGQQRLLAIAMVLAFRPHLMILDEPLAGLKESALEQILHLITRESKNRKVLLIEHSLPAIQSVASKVWFMQQGSLTEFDSYEQMAASDVYEKYYSSPPFTSRPTMAQPQQTAVVNLPGRIQQEAPVLRVRSLCAGYYRQPVLESVSFDLYRGDVVCVTGPNGSGKSTLLRAIVGTAKQFGGTIELNGMLLDPLPPHKRVQAGLRFLPQELRLFRTLSLRDNVTVAVAPLKRKAEQSTIGKSEQANDSIDAILNQLSRAGLILRNSRRSESYSGGEQARVALLLLDLGNVKVLLMDEPTTGIDGLGLSALVEKVQYWQRAGIPIIIVEHNISFVKSVASRILMVEDGRITEI